jgi:acetyl-CoA acyltransferase 1
VQPPYANNDARSAAIAGGFPVTVPVQTVNRFCSSGLMAVKTIADAISSGSIDIGIAVGSESISN